MSAQLDPSAFFFKATLLALLGWGASHWRSETLPQFMETSSQLQNEPLQTPSNAKPFTLNLQNQNYQLEPIFTYELWGLVVSTHDSSSWKDISHEKWQDYLNSHDLCVIWGQNLFNPHFSKLNFTHGDWTCYVQTNSSAAWQSFKENQLSNNHVLPATAEIKKLLEGARIGDEIHLKGELVNYRVNQGPVRKSSVVRTDRDNGACEIIYVQEFSTLKRHNGFWIRVSAIAKALSVFFAIGLLLAIVFRVQFIRYWPF